jgi:hypothetical protein
MLIFKPYRIHDKINPPNASVKKTVGKFASFLKKFGRE